MNEDGTQRRTKVPRVRPQGRRRQPAEPWPEAYPERRDSGVLKEDGASVRRQVSGLVRGEESDAWRERTTRQLARQRSRFPELPQIDLLSQTGGRIVPVIAGELLVTADISADPQLLALVQGFGDPEPVKELEDRVLRVRSSVPTPRLESLARFIREAGFAASVNHVTPLGPLAKGSGGPERTRATLGLPDPEAAAAPVTVVVIDTGITRDPRTDEWLAGLAVDLSGEGGNSNIDPLDEIPQDKLLDLGAGHGTFAAGVVAQVAPSAALQVLRAVRSDGIGDEVDVAVAMVQAVAQAPEGGLVINLSLGAETVDDQPLLAIEVALDLLQERRPDCLVIAAAGNSGTTRPMFPAASRRVVAVGALTADHVPAEWSNHGYWVDCSCIGEGVLSTFVHGQESPDSDDAPETWPDDEDPWALWSGTSFAAPQVAAAVARRVAESGGTPREALAWLFDQAPKVPDMGHALRFLPGTPLA